jgi:tripartite-type tricarboxylate transporter receptor subunit TctC
LLVNTSAQAYSAALLKNLPYDPLKDFIPVAPLTSQPAIVSNFEKIAVTSPVWGAGLPAAHAH